MPGASKERKRIKNLNANWVPGGTGKDGRFELKRVTDDDQEYVVPASAASMTALATLATAGTVMAWDPLNRALILANLVGTMPWTMPWTTDGS